MASFQYVSNLHGSPSSVASKKPTLGSSAVSAWQWMSPNTGGESYQLIFNLILPNQAGQSVHLLVALVGCLLLSITMNFKGPGKDCDLSSAVDKEPEGMLSLVARMNGV